MGGALYVEYIDTYAKVVHPTNHKIIKFNPTVWPHPSIGYEEIVKTLWIGLKKKVETIK